MIRRSRTFRIIRIFRTSSILALLLAVGSATTVHAAVLTLDEALRTAQKQQPNVRAARATVRAAEAQVDEARAPLFPRIDASASWSLSGSSVGMSDPLDPSDILRFGVGGSILLWDFGQTRSRWRAASASADAEEQSAEQVESDTALRVRTAFFRARAARDLVAVARETLENEARHLEQITAYVEVGTRPEIDLYQSRTAIANAKVALIRAENAYESAKAELDQAMGVERTGSYDVADDSMPPVAGEDKSIDDLAAEAVAARPDVAAAALEVRAQQLSVDAARAEYLPSFVGTSGLDFTTLAGDGLDWGWSVGVALSWPIFDGWARRAGVRAAEATVEVLDARATTVRQAVRVELHQALLAVRASKGQLSASGEAVEAARERLRLAEARYTEGVGNSIELADAQVAVTLAASQRVQADFELATARAQLLHALGR